MRLAKAFLGDTSDVRGRSVMLFETMGPLRKGGERRAKLDESQRCRQRRRLRLPFVCQRFLFCFIVSKMCGTTSKSD